jgi:hypothetical protein
MQPRSRRREGRVNKVADAGQVVFGYAQAVGVVWDTLGGD